MPLIHLHRTAQEGERHEEPLARLMSVPGFSRLLPVFQSFMGERHLAVEEFRDEGSLVVRVELPGIDPDKDIELTVSDSTLRIHAERREEKQIREKDRYRSEFHYGTLFKSVQLPRGASERDIEATYKAGILEVRVPAATAEKAVEAKVPVRVA